MQNPFNVTRESFDFYVPVGYVEKRSWFVGKPVLLLTTKPVYNPIYDARTRYGLRSKEVIAPRTKLVHYPGQMDKEKIKELMKSDDSVAFNFFREGVMYEGTRKGEYIGYPNSEFYKLLLEASIEIKVETVSDWARIMDNYGDGDVPGVLDMAVENRYLTFEQAVDVHVMRLNKLYSEE